MTRAGGSDIGSPAPPAGTRYPATICVSLPSVSRRSEASVITARGLLAGPLANECSLTAPGRIHANR